MATRGRKPTPTHLKLVKGNPGKRALPVDEPMPELKIPQVPADLCDDAKLEWGRVSIELDALGLLSGLDRSALAAYCQAYGRWISAERALRALAGDKATCGGLLAQTTNGNLIQNPLIGIANKAASDMVRYASEFAMTPSARSRVQVDAKNTRTPDPLEKYLRK